MSMKAFVVAEIGSNWEGDLTKAKKFTISLIPIGMRLKDPNFHFRW